MNVVSMVSNLQSELNYYKGVSKEQSEIIKQLVEGPGEVEYIHPFDLGERINKATEVVDILKHVSHPLGDVIEIDGRKFKQSAFIPAKVKPKFIK